MLVDCQLGMQIVHVIWRTETNKKHRSDAHQRHIYLDTHNIAFDGWLGGSGAGWVTG